MSEADKLADLPEPGAALTDNAELLFRNVRKHFFQEGHVSAQVFEPSPVDKQLLSLDRASLSSPQEAFARFLATKGASSSGILSVVVEECLLHTVPVLENALPENAAHVVADFRPHNRSQTKKRAGKLRDLAVTRGWHLGPK